MMQSLGEMATQLPIRAPSNLRRALRRPSLGFAVGWNYWFSWPSPAGARGRIADRQILVPAFQLHVWALGFFALLLALNLLSVKA